MINQVAHTKDFHLNGLHKVAGTASLSVGALLLAAAIDLVHTVTQPGTAGWLSPLQNNWLVVIFKLHASFKGIQSNLLYQLNLLDIVILALIATVYTGLYIALRRTSKAWAMVAFVQPFLGIVLFIATKTAGRSSVMGAELVISVVMLRSDLFDRRIAYAGMLSGVLLFAGDIGASTAPSNILAILMGVGYTLLMAWFFLVGRRLFQLGRSN